MAHGIELSAPSTAEPKNVSDRFLLPWTGPAFVVSALCSAYYLYVAAVGIEFPQLDRSLFIYFGIVLAFALRPASSASIALRLLDVFIIVGATIATIHFNMRYNEFLEMVGAPISNFDAACAWFLIVASLESCRRVLGWSIPILAVLFLVFLRYGTWVPAPLTHIDFDWSTIASYMYAGTDGLYSDLTYVLASQMYLFLVFGTFLMRAGAADYFAQASVALVGDRTGGTAKAAVASSAIIGSITGSAAANAAVAGSVTIPLMIAAGFKRHVAGGIEAAASTGGTVLPPVMGVAAFIMVSLTGIPYTTIALYSAVPAILYYVCVYAQVHFYASRNHLSGMPRSELPPLGPTLASGWYYVAPIVVIVTMVALNYSLAFTALAAIVASFLTSWFRKATRMGIRATLGAMASGAQQALPIMVVAGPVAIMSECLLLPGTGLRVTGMILDVGHGNLEVTLLLVYVIAYVLGMGLSVVPAYIILATLAAPALIQLHVPVLAAHLLVMWWSQASNIKPPVALAVYVTSSIAGSPLWATGWAAVLKGAGLFFIPVLFIYQPSILFNGTTVEIVLTLTTVTAGIITFAAAIEGYFRRPLSIPARILFGIGGIALLLNYSLIVFAVAVAFVAAGYFLSEAQWRARAPIQ